MGRALRRLAFTLAVVVSLPMMGLTGCSNGAAKGPTVTSTLPAAGATGVAVDTAVSAVFSEALDPAAAGPGALALSQGSLTIGGSVIYDAATHTITLQPQAALDPSTTYTATVAASVADAAGHTLGKPHTWSFTTAAGAGTGCSSVTYSAPSGSANDIVFTFDKTYPCGQYANGDWWVAPQTAGGTVTISSINPAPATRSGTGTAMNGVMVNPTSTSKYGFDGDAGSGRGGLYDASLNVAMPLTVDTTATPITSVIKAVSTPDIPTASNATILQFMAVLTVEASAADRTGDFRPSYMGTSGKLQETVASIDTSGMGTMDFTSIPSVAAYSWSQMATDFSYLQMDNIVGWQDQFIKAVDDIPSHAPAVGYGSDYGNFINKGFLRFASNDFDYANADCKQALIDFLQVEIDAAGAVQAGMTFLGDGGYGWSRKFPMLWAGKVLGDATITAQANKPIFGEDTTLYVSTATGKVLHGEVGDYGDGVLKDYWYGAANSSGSKTVRDPMEWVDGGSYDEGSYLECCVEAQESYTGIAAYWLGFTSNATVLEVLHISNRLADRGTQFLPDIFAPYTGTGFADYGVTYGENTATPGYYFTGAGRWPSADRSFTRYHTIPMGEDLWTYWKAHDDYQAPAAISDLADTPGTGSNVLTWTEPAGTPDHYDVYRATNSTLSNYTYLQTTTSTTYTDSGLTAGATYGYHVVAIDAAGNVSDTSNIVSGTAN